MARQIPSELKHQRNLFLVGRRFIDGSLYHNYFDSAGRNLQPLEPTIKGDIGNLLGNGLNAKRLCL